MLKTRSPNLIALIIALIAAPVLAGDGNFQPLNLARNSGQSRWVVTGRTAGSYSLSSIANVASIPNLQGKKKPCIGYGAPNPDHIMVLEQDFAKLKLQVDSGGKDSTLVVVGPKDNNIRCDFGSNDRKDAKIQGRNWKKGTYKIWVGAIDSGKKWNYRLSATVE